MASYTVERVALGFNHSPATDDRDKATYYLGALFVSPPVRNPKAVAAHTRESLAHQLQAEAAAGTAPALLLGIDAVPGQEHRTHEGKEGTLFAYAGRSALGTNAEIGDIKQLVARGMAELKSQAARYDEEHPVPPVDIWYYTTTLPAEGYTMVKTSQRQE